MTADISLKLFDLTYEFIKDKDKAKEFVYKIEQTIDNKFHEEKEHLATKKDIQEVKTNIAELKSDMMKWLIALFLPFYIGMIVFLIKNFL